MKGLGNPELDERLGPVAGELREEIELVRGASHAFELDDVHEEAISHPGAVVVPAALALAEQTDASVGELLEAVAVGYEAMGRAGIAVGPAAHMLGGFHPTSMSGVFGAAAAAGTLLGFGSATLTHAFGLAVSLASGTMEFAASGGMAKRIHAGRAAEGGLTAALLADQGFEGADDGLAGRYGFCRIFTDEPRIELLTEQLGERWMMDEITIKPWAACSDIHPMIQATVELRAEHGLTADVIDRIEATGPTKAATQNSLDGTTSVMAAQYSAQWNIAAAIVADPADPATYDEDRIADPAIAALQAKVVSVDAAPEFDATYAWKMGGGVRITLTDGTVLERTVHGQHAVEVVQLVLEELGIRGPEPSAHAGLSLRVLVAQRDRPMAAHPDQQGREAHAVVPERERLLRRPGDLRVQHCERRVAEIDGDEPERGPDLGCGDRTAEPVLLAESGQGRLEPLLCRAKPGVGRIAHGRARHPQPRVTDLEHGCRCGWRHVPDHTGRPNAKVVPAPGRLSTSSRPPCRSTIRLAIASPRPACPPPRCLLPAW